MKEKYLGERNHNNLFKNYYCDASVQGFSPAIYLGQREEVTCTNTKGCLRCNMVNKNNNGF